jgi:hypothetical protein
MKRLFKYILPIFFAVLLCSAKTEEKQFDEYRGGRSGYSSVTLRLYNDSTYHYSQWDHTRSTIEDNGKWKRISDHYCLNSTSKTRRTWRGGKSDRFYRFEQQEFMITGDALQFVPKDAKDNDYFAEYYRLY